MKSSEIILNKLCWSRRFEKACFINAYAEFMVYLIFIDNENNGWYHCSEIDFIERRNEKND
tara:strand:+ start:87 stop:269 length:183 start_codon:yes stop_codon:yes gene_type:complete